MSAAPALQPPSSWQVQRAMSAAMSLIASLGDDADEVLKADMLEGETDALEIVRRLVRAALDAESMAEAANQRIGDIIVRRDRFKQRAEAARETVKQMLDALGVHRVQAEDFTASLKMAPPKVLITDEQQLADEFVRVQRSPDRTAIGRAIDEGREVRGATKSNVGLGFVLSVRTR